MAIHDWTRVPAGIFHDFHIAWITHLKEALNEGLLPKGYYALSEQHAGRVIADVLTHLTLVDLFMPTAFDPHGVHGQIWEYFDPEDYVLPTMKPLTFAAYCSGDVPDAYVTHLAVGDEAPAMPLFLTVGSYVNLPLARTYSIAWQGVPEYWRSILSD